MHLVKPSPGIYRSLERNEVAFGEEGGGRSDSHSGQRSGSGGSTTTSITARTPVSRPARRQRRPPAGAEATAAAAAAAAAERRGGAAGGARARSRRVHASPHFQSNSGAFRTPARGWGLREQPRSQPQSSQRSLPSPVLRLPGSAPRRGVRSCAPGAPPGHPGSRSQDKAMKPALLEVMRMNRICRMVLATCLGSFILVIFYFQSMLHPGRGRVSVVLLDIFFFLVLSLPRSPWLVSDSSNLTSSLWATSGFLAARICPDPRVGLGRKDILLSLLPPNSRLEDGTRGAVDFFFSLCYFFILISLHSEHFSV